jgi:2-polyprenyl-6-methoxyphenol hydroxylase-like FAD-dependent oxidoreductase
LASAIGLARAGWKCDVLEPAPHQRGLGHGMLLPPPAREALERLGGGPIEAFTAPIDTFAIHHPDGTLQRRFAIPGSLSVLHRDLLAQLERALPADVARHSERCVGLEGSPELGYRVVGASGRRWEGQLIVAADGVGSLCRAALFPKARLTPEQVSELGLVVPRVTLAQGQKHSCRKFQHPSAGLALGLVPCRNNQAVLYAQIATHRHPLPNPTEGHRFLQQLFSDWNPELRALLKDLDPTIRVHRWRTTDLDPLPALHRGNVVLVGDSGHPMLPFSSQGAAGAMEGALRLSSQLEHLDGDPQSLRNALMRYSASRLPELTPLLQEGRALRRQFLEPDRVAEETVAPLAGFPTAPEMMPETAAVERP